MPQAAGLLSVGTAVPPHLLDQETAAAAAHETFAGRYGDFERVARVFETSGIRTRYMAQPLEWYFERLGWAERNTAYLGAASDLFVKAASRALESAGLSAAEVDTVVTVSSTGIATPSLEARAARRLGFREDVARVPVFGLGCAGGTSGLSIASRLAQSRPGEVVLLVVVELCTVAFRSDKLSKANIVATALFGDGAAACVLRCGREGDPVLAEIEAAGEHMWCDTLDIMGWHVEQQGLGVIFDRSIPPFAEERILPAVTQILSRDGLAPDDVSRFTCHPGGAKVIQALERALPIEQGALDHERDVLANYGNMSAPTILFVLDNVVRAGLPSRTLLTAMGPGFTASCVSLRCAA